MERSMFENYKDKYSESAIIKKLFRIMGIISSKALRMIVTLVVMLRHEDVPAWVKISIIGVLGYLICPFDLFPDFILGGLLDDIAAISALFVEVSAYKTEEIEKEVDEMIAKF
jgi:uncharacterized membrane protein YkvA (DUF1232 family)